MSRTESIVVDHAKIYVSEHLMSVCQRMGISIQPAGTREGCNGGPLGQSLRTEPEEPPQHLRGPAGSDIDARGLDTAAYAIDSCSKLIYPRCSVTGRISRQEPHDGSR